MSTTSPIPALSDDHIDLLVSAASAWHVLTSRTTAAFVQGSPEHPIVVATATEMGRLLRGENAAAVAWLSEQGRTRLVDRAEPAAYSHRPVDHLDPVEVIKAAHAAQVLCAPSPSWSTSSARRALAAVITAATHRLPGYADAPWSWTRPQHRSGPAVGIAVDERHPEIPGLTWITPEQAREHWAGAQVVVVTIGAAGRVPADLPRRSGIFVLANGESDDAVWEALTILDMQVLSLSWPLCEPWLLEQLSAPAREFVEHRSNS